MRDLSWAHRCRLPNGATPMMFGYCDITTGTRHVLHAEEPLHIEASVLCRQCGDHGWIRDGRWVVIP